MTLQFGAKLYQFAPALNKTVASCITKADNNSPNDAVSNVFWHYQLSKDTLVLKDNDANVEQKAHHCMKDAMETSGLKVKTTDTPDVFTVTKKTGEPTENLGSLLAPAEPDAPSIWSRKPKN